MRKALLIPGALAVVTALVIAGCGGSSGSGTAGASSGGGMYGTPAGGAKEETAVTAASREALPATAATPVSLGSAAGVGKVLVDAEGMTLYYFEKDQKGGGKSKCSGACAEAWPPLTTGSKPAAMKGVKSSMLGTIKRSDGTTQVTYAGWPLYTFVEDKKPGEDNGTDLKAFGASWYPLHSNGMKAGH